jgi:hypothetical protein
MKLRVVCWMSGHRCRLALDESPPYKLCLLTLRRYLSRYNWRSLPYLSLVSCYLTLPSFLPPEPHLHLNSKSSPHTVAESIQNYRNFRKAARTRKSTKNHQLQSPSAGFIWQLCQKVLSRHNGRIHLVEEPSPLTLLPLVERTKVGLPHPFGKLVQGEIFSVQPN